jgi:hypothetical protein
MSPRHPPLPLPLPRTIRSDCGERIVVAFLTCARSGSSPVPAHPVVVFADCECGERIDIARACAEA